MSHLDTRLELTNGTVVAYLGPRQPVEPVYRNELNVAPRTGGRPQISRDLQRWSTDIEVQGQFLHTDNLPAEHRTALQTLFGALPVTPQDQMNRLVDLVVYGDGGPFHLFVGAQEYTAATTGAVDAANGVYPNVDVAEMRFPQGAIDTRVNWFLRFSPGVQR